MIQLVMALKRSLKVDFANDLAHELGEKKQRNPLISAR
jgi:hypothetical protein